MKNSVQKMEIQLARQWIRFLKKANKGATDEGTIRLNNDTIKATKKRIQELSS